MKPFYRFRNPWGRSEISGKVVDKGKYAYTVYHSDFVEQFFKSVGIELVVWNRHRFSGILLITEEDFQIISLAIDELPPQTALPLENFRTLIEIRKIG